MLKLTQMQEEFRDAIGRLLEKSTDQPSTSSDTLDLLNEPCESTEDLEGLCSRLQDPAYRKKMIRYLSLQGGGSLGDAVRRMLRKIGSNSLWTEYSFKGRKGKLSFEGLPINDVIIRACNKCYPEAKCQEIEDMIAVTLKHAPHRGRTNNQASHQETLEKEA
ncbi:uncharacterized protein LOC143511712 [Brachyhypopomus gauderio]|uniref:uncharacterized protein LOC143511712 n=1 Tax=Brachyhypopomus gauderio TaxID=698409 RepID=UPI004041CB31